MRKLLLLCTFLIVISCKDKTNTLKSPRFLVGEWKRLDDKPSQQTFEVWNTNLVGMGYTMKGKKRSFQKILSIVKLNDTLHLEVKGVNRKSTLFKFTNQTDTSFICENQQNKFPKKITYFKDDKQLKAILADDDFRIDFIFEKVN